MKDPVNQPMAAASCISIATEGHMQSLRIMYDRTILFEDFTWENSIPIAPSLSDDEVSEDESDNGPTMAHHMHDPTSADEMITAEQNGPLPCSIEIIDSQPAVIAYGDEAGDLLIEKLQSSEDENQENLENHENCVEFPAPDNQQYPVTCLQYHSLSNRLFALLDRGESAGWGFHEGGLVRVIDVNDMTEISQLHEILDHYELCTVLPLDCAGNELVGGAVKLSQERWTTGDFCRMCDDELPAALCSHQRRSSNASLAFFDLRAGNAPGSMVSRHPLPHRSLYPRMQLAKEHYILTSHAGAPLVIWDRRKLDAGPVTCPNLEMTNALTDRPKGCRSGPFVNGLVARRSNSLYLSCYGHTLAGRADSGQMWVWDLTKILGWSSDDVSNKQLLGEVGTSLKNGATVSYKPLKSLYVPYNMPPFHSGENVRPRVPVWIGPDWIVAAGARQLTYFRLSNSDRKRREKNVR